METEIKKRNRDKIEMKQYIDRLQTESQKDAGREQDLKQIISAKEQELKTLPFQPRMVEQK